MTLIAAKFDVDLINIYKITNCKTKWPPFGLLCRLDTGRRSKHCCWNRRCHSCSNSCSLQWLPIDDFL